MQIWEIFRIYAEVYELESGKKDKEEEIKQYSLEKQDLDITIIE